MGWAHTPQLRYIMVKIIICLEVVSQPRIRPEGKAQADSRAQLHEVCEHFERPATPPSGVRRGYEATSIDSLEIDNN
jgi:hypothetical protein